MEEKEYIEAFIGKSRDTQDNENVDTKSVPSALKLCKDELTIAVIAMLAGIVIVFLFHCLCKSGFMNEDHDGTDSEKNPKAEFIARKSWSVSETMYRAQKKPPERS